jgi:hypothetical protein
MQRTSVDLPVPDGPIIAVMPEPAISTDMLVKTGFPATYDLLTSRNTRAASEVFKARPPYGLAGTAAAGVGSAAFFAASAAFLAAASASRLASASYAALLYGVPDFSATSRTTAQSF